MSMSYAAAAGSTAVRGGQGHDERDADAKDASQDQSQVDHQQRGNRRQLEQGALSTVSDAALKPLKMLLEQSRRVLTITGAGCSTESGIPDYRDAAGGWKRKPPVQFQDFVGSGSTRRRYWARSLVGWRTIASARPNAAHEALAELECAGVLQQLITQNVDGLHQRAGSRAVIDLHGRLDVITCLDCGMREPRQGFQARLADMNPGWEQLDAEQAPDGDADLENVDYNAFRVPHCDRCAGMLKPDVVFYGENVPRTVVDMAFARLEAADLLLVAGSSLMVWSGYRFVRHAAARGIPVAILNLGKTRGDPQATVKLEARCGDVLPRIAGLQVEI